MEETHAASAEDQPDGAPAQPDEAASTDGGAPAGPPEGFIEQGRYDNLRADYNRKAALWDRAQQGDVEAMRELKLPLDFGETDEETDTEEDPVFQDPRVDALIAQQAQAQEQAILQDVRGHIENLLDEADVELSDRVRKAILSEAWLRGGGAQIQPDTTETVVKEWIDEYKQLERSAGDRYIERKKSAPAVSGVGTGANEAPFRDDMSIRELTQAAQERARLLSDQ